MSVKSRKYNLGCLVSLNVYLCVKYRIIRTHRIILAITTYIEVIMKYDK